MSEEHHSHHLYRAHIASDGQVILHQCGEAESSRGVGLSQLLFSRGRVRVHTVSGEVPKMMYVIRYEWEHGERIEWIYAQTLEILIRTLAFLRDGGLL